MTRKVIWFAALWIGLLAAQAGGEEAPTLKTKKDRASYGFGVDIGRNFKRNGIEIDPELVLRGLRDALSGGPFLLEEKELRRAIGGLQGEMRQKQVIASRRSAEQNRLDGEKFLAENKAKDGVVTLPSGLQYKILQAGSGKTPTDNDTVQVKYRGTLVDGTEFDSSEWREEPSAFKVSAVVPGLKEAMKLMPVGSKWQLVIPPQLAYGARGTGRDVGPNATLIFELEVVGIK